MPRESTEGLKTGVEVTIFTPGLEELRESFVSRLSDIVRGKKAIIGFSLEPNLDSNCVVVIGSSRGGLIFDQLPEEPMGDFCTRIGDTLKREGIMGVLIVTDRTVPKEHIGVIEIK